MKTKSAAARPISFTFLVQIVLIANSFIMLYPVVVMIFSAFKGTAEIFEHPFALPDFQRRRKERVHGVVVPAEQDRRERDVAQSGHIVG